LARFELKAQWDTSWIVPAVLTAVFVAAIPEVAENSGIPSFMPDTLDTLIEVTTSNETQVALPTPPPPPPAPAASAEGAAPTTAKPEVVEEEVVPTPLPDQVVETTEPVPQDEPEEVTSTIRAGGRDVAIMPARRRNALGDSYKLTRTRETRAIDLPVRDGPPVEMSEDQLTVIKRVLPGWPEDDMLLGKKDHFECTVTVEINVEGLPDSMETTGCLAQLARISENALSQWIWQPPTVDGYRVRARTRIRVDFDRKR